jgi:hypothetical protein
MSRKPTPNASAGEIPHIRIPNWIIDLPAFGKLKASAVRVYVQLLRLSDGKNNGRLFLSGRDGASICNMNKDTVVAALRELDQAGFLENTRQARYSKHERFAAEWRLTHLKCNISDREPSLTLASTAVRAPAPKPTRPRASKRSGGGYPVASVRH